MVSVTSASHYVTTASMYIRGLIPRNSTESAEADPIGVIGWLRVNMYILRMTDRISKFDAYFYQMADRYILFDIYLRKKETQQTKI